VYIYIRENALTELSPRQMKFEINIKMDRNKFTVHTAVGNRFITGNPTYCDFCTMLNGSRFMLPECSQQVEIQWEITHTL
jgi:hypothetical protein